MAREVLEWNLTYLRRTFYIHPVLEGEGGKPTRMKYELSRNPSGNRVCSECRESTADHHPPSTTTHRVAFLRCCCCSSCVSSQTKQGIIGRSSCLSACQGWMAYSVMHLMEAVEDGRRVCALLRCTRSGWSSPEKRSGSSVCSGTTTTM